MPQLRVPTANDYERSVLRNVQTFGWHCTSVFSKTNDPAEPPFSYTVGLQESYGGPEFIMFGLESKVAHSILGLCAERLKDMRPLDLNQLNHDLIDGYPCLFVQVPRDRYNDYVYSALWFYAELEFPMFQIVWPDSDGRFPWHQGADESFKLSQPVLGQPAGV